MRLERGAFKWGYIHKSNLFPAKNTTLCKTKTNLLNGSMCKIQIGTHTHTHTNTHTHTRTRTHARTHAHTQHTHTHTFKLATVHTNKVNKLYDNR